MDIVTKELIKDFTQSESSKLDADSPENVLLTVNDYEEYFDAKQYLTEYYTSEDGHNGENSPLAFVLDALEKITRHLQAILPVSVDERTLLEFGCGPTVHTVMSLSDVYDAVYFADKLLSCRDQIHYWWRQSPMAFDWRRTARFVAELEFASCSYAEFPANIYECEITTQLEHRLRSHIHGIHACDLLPALRVDKFAPLPPCIEGLPVPTMDCVLSSLCLEAVSTTIAHYNTSMRLLAALLKPGGYLILVGILHTNHYELASHKFPILNVDEMTLRCALRFAGLSGRIWYRQCSKTGKTQRRDFDQFVYTADDEETPEFEDMFVEDIRLHDGEISAASHFVRTTNNTCTLPFFVATKERMNDDRVRFLQPMYTSGVVVNYRTEPMGSEQLKYFSFTEVFQPPAWACLVANLLIFYAVNAIYSQRFPLPLLQQKSLAPKVLVFASLWIALTVSIYENGLLSKLLVNRGPALIESYDELVRTLAKGDYRMVVTRNSNVAHFLAAQTANDGHEKLRLAVAKHKALIVKTRSDQIKMLTTFRKYMVVEAEAAGFGLYIFIKSGLVINQEYFV